ncbi:MAG: helix-turn-helix transcriptional regulator [Lachnospiraceae bacterium]|nr:helix-turn-helix transcriptional regulator [Lachnospiraceae bacterium]
MSIINDRFREIRNDYKLSQEEFGSRIGLSKSGISNIESGKRNVTDKHIKLLCSSFPINEEWLRNGTEPKSVKTPSSVMEQLKKEFNLDEFVCNLVYEYLKLEPKQREVVRNFLSNVIKEEPNFKKKDTTENQENSTDFQETCTVEEAEAEYIKSRSKPARKMAQYVLNTTEDAAKSDTAANQ